MEQKSRSWGGKRIGAGRPRTRRKHGSGELSQLMERIAFVHDAARDLAKENVANWKCPALGWELRAFAIQDDLQAVVSMLDALVCGDAGLFEGPAFREWRARRNSVDVIITSH